MPVKSLRDTVSETEGHRLPVHKERNGDAYYSYSNGVEFKTTKVADGVKGRMKEVREISGIKTPHMTATIPYSEGQYERIFGKGKTDD